MAPVVSGKEPQKKVLVLENDKSSSGRELRKTESKEPEKATFNLILPTGKQTGGYTKGQKTLAAGGVESKDSVHVGDNVAR